MHLFMPFTKIYLSKMMNTPQPQDDRKGHHSYTTASQAEAFV